MGAAGGEVVRVGFAFLDAATDHFYLGELSDGYARRNLTTLLTQVMRKRAGPIFCSNTCLLGELIDVIFIRTRIFPSFAEVDVLSGPVSGVFGSRI